MTRLVRFLILVAVGISLGSVVLRGRPTVLYQQGAGPDRIQVVERPDGLRELYLGTSRNRQTALHPDRPEELELPYTRVAVLALALVEPNARILFVGLGGGSMPRYARWLLPGAEIHAVEIDPRVVEAAREWFAFRTDTLMEVHVGDGRAFIQASPPSSWDLVVLDAFSGGEVPIDLATVEFLEAVRASLTPGGIVVGNLHTTSPLYDAMVASYGAVFQGVALVDVPRRRQRIVVAGPSGALGEEPILARVRGLARRKNPGFDLEGLVASGYRPSPPPRAPVLRDAR